MKYLLLIIINFLTILPSYSAPEQASLSKENHKISILKRSIIAEMKMTKEKIMDILGTNDIEFEHSNNSFRFKFNEKQMMIIYDENADRMRIICPIVEVNKVNIEQLQKALEANFHTNLDSRYAISNEIVWSVFIHPLSNLSENLFLSALHQTYTSAMTFGNEYSSGYLSFPKADKIKE